MTYKVNFLICYLRLRDNLYLVNNFPGPLVCQSGYNIYMSEHLFYTSLYPSNSSSLAYHQLTNLKSHEVRAFYLAQK